MQTIAPQQISYPCLLADIGGTNARFCLETAPGEIQAVVVYPCRAYAQLGDAILAYLGEPAAVAAGAMLVKRAGIAIANPVDGDRVQMTNHHWSFSIQAMQQQLRLEQLLVVNDFKALAMALPFLAPEQKVQVGAGYAKENGVIGLLGAGTGLGVSALIPYGSHWLALDSEGGHVSFSPANELEAFILHYAWREHPHVSAERLLSGIGLDIIYRALAAKEGLDAEPLTVADIIQRALQQQSALCVQTLACFCDMLGTAAGNLAVTLGAKGGIYIGGGIVPRLGRFFTESGFRGRFEEKGRFSGYLQQIPTYVITAEYPAFVGVSAMLAQAQFGPATVR
ncbi:glucokinase [Undibacterium sp.]|jgi:glucokinase|uniref:glucokinase n=1 Tax=Undibacterium sp. TaxID=1914977 RepID=UPI002C933E48|nr:glucokinase [Undibacterium sp.]HTD06912.1 glucokinase [Undibacterium sp.]